MERRTRYDIYQDILETVLRRGAVGITRISYGANLPVDRAKEAVEFLMENRLLYVASSKLNLGKKSKRDLFEKTPLIYREYGSATRNAMENFILTNKLSVNKKIELTSNEAVKQAVISGLGCSIMPLIGIKNELINNDLQIIPVKGLPIITTWNIVWLKSKKLSPVATAYLDFINSNREEIIHEKFSWINNY